MHKLLVFFLFFLTSFTIAQQSSLSGFVVDFEDDEPLIGASVKIIGQKDESQNIGSVTDINGEFKISNLNQGEYSLTISYIGYIDKVV